MARDQSTLDRIMEIIDECIFVENSYADGITYNVLVGIEEAAEAILKEFDVVSYPYQKKFLGYNAWGDEIWKED